jgi:hypothetical protein
MIISEIGNLELFVLMHDSSNNLEVHSFSISMDRHCLLL